MEQITPQWCAFDNEQCRSATKNSTRKQYMPQTGLWHIDIHATEKAKPVMKNGGAAERTIRKRKLRCLKGGSSRCDYDNAFIFWRTGWGLVMWWFISQLQWLFMLDTVNTYTELLILLGPLLFNDIDRCPNYARGLSLIFMFHLITGEGK